jgi:cytochrome P450 family 3 subfamily A
LYLFFIVSVIGGTSLIAYHCACLLQIPVKLGKQGLLQAEKPIVLKVVPRDGIISGA